MDSNASHVYLKLKTRSFLRIATEKKTTKSNFSIGLSSNGYKEGEMRRKYRVQEARRQKC
ncbi:Protein CBG06548 [Caenorhabditis briggsae]|uniref:Protein CBG06548 n=1 Tax=Caenorhabditis briggsae TaxID=6238 RepID=A8X2H9_CAEBR|nr:Protein CBG06548 [Caenorhabditis briggsae]CAP26839.1 Protein CBG06548 [Caenorhabditis briggsae]